MNAVQLGIQFSQEIEAVRTNGNWKWEKRVSGPLSWEDVNTITQMAGCWSDYPSANEGESIKFYTNHNHPDHGGRL